MYVFCKKQIVFGDISQNRFWDLQTMCNVVGTLLASFLTYSETLGRLRRPARRSRSLSGSSRSSRASSGHPPRTARGSPKPWISKDFLENLEKHDFPLKIRSCQIDSGMFLNRPGHAYVAGNTSQTLRVDSTVTSSGDGWGRCTQ